MAGFDLYRMYWFSWWSTVVLDTMYRLSMCPKYWSPSCFFVRNIVEIEVYIADRAVTAVIA